MRRGGEADLTFAIICRDFPMRTSNPMLHYPRSFGRGPFAGAGVGFRLSAFLAVLGDEIDRARLQLGKNLPDIFPDNANHDELHATENEVRPSIESPTSRPALNVVMPCARAAGS